MASTITELNKNYQADDADISLVSSDGIVFKVHSFHLASASPVFRDMLKLASGATPPNNELRLSDTAIETAAPVATFLDIIYGKGVFATAKVTRRFNLRSLEAVASLVIKYQCSMVSRYISLLLQRSLSTSDSEVLEIFVIAARMDDVETCRRAIALGGSWIYGWPKDTSRFQQNADQERQMNEELSTCDSLIGVGGLDLSAAPCGDFARIPPYYANALLSAIGTCVNSPRQSADWKGISWTFAAPRWQRRCWLRL